MYSADVVCHPDRSVGTGGSTGRRGKERAFLDTALAGKPCRSGAGSRTANPCPFSDRGPPGVRVRRVDGHPGQNAGYLEACHRANRRRLPANMRNPYVRPASQKPGFSYTRGRLHPATDQQVQHPHDSQGPYHRQCGDHPEGHGGVGPPPSRFAFGCKGVDTQDELACNTGVAI
jgi:hypothetical protein